MGRQVGVLLSLLLTALGAVSLPEGTLGLGIALVALSLLLLTHSAIARALDVRSHGPLPPGTIDVSAPLSQSDPDADGHPRPRAPGRAALAA